jgi:hypothetical protein
MTRFLSLSVFALNWVATYALDGFAQRSVQLPVVDLGYGRYQASLNVNIFPKSRH